MKSTSAKLRDRLLGHAKLSNGDSDAKSFNTVQALEQAYDTIERGRRSVPLDKIVGSVGRYKDFDSHFRIRHHMPQDRFDRIVAAMRAGKHLPPVKIYQVKDEYYVLDGHHRIAAAKHLRHSEIRAKVIEFIPSTNTFENALYREKMAFLDKTGLPYAIELTEFWEYDYLLKQINSHQDALNREAAEPVTFHQTAEDWYQTIYRPLHAIIKRNRLVNSFPKRTIDDLYAYISYHQWEKGWSRKLGIGIDRLIPKDMEVFRKHMANFKEFEYPEMIRTITAFILMNVKPKGELRIINKLFALDEVTEVHSVHGEVDLIIKIVLTRDLLSSDAEVIAQFVYEKMRQIPGVVSTQTLIPGNSRVKEQVNIKPSQS